MVVLANIGYTVAVVFAVTSIRRGPVVGIATRAAPVAAKVQEAPGAVTALAVVVLGARRAVWKEAALRRAHLVEALKLAVLVSRADLHQGS